MSGYIWSLAQLEELAVHSDPTVQDWAIRKWFLLYPDSAWSRLPQFLEDSRQAVVNAALFHLGATPQPHLVPLLSNIYLHGEPDTSAQAIEVLGDWQVEEAVGWMKQRILQGTGLQRVQIDGMIRALGQIPTDEAWELLKSTESSVIEGESRSSGEFYVALLSHHRAGDVDAVLKNLVQTTRDHRQLEALGVLLSLIDLRLNPTEVFYGGGAVAQKHVQRRLEEIEGELTAIPAAALKEAAAGGWTEATAEERLTALDAFRRLLNEYREPLESSFFYQVATKAATLLQTAVIANDDHHALLFLAWYALLAAIVPDVAAEPADNGSWQDRLRLFLRDQPPLARDVVFAERIRAVADRADLAQRLRSVLKEEPESWRAVRAVLLLGELKAVEVLPELIDCISRSQDQYGQEEIYRALSKIGEPAVTALLPLMDGSDRAARAMAWRILSDLPTVEGVQAQVARLGEVYQQNPEQTLEQIRQSGARQFLPFVEGEYRPGELNLGRTLIHLSGLHGLRSDWLIDVERDIKRLEGQTAESHDWPRVFNLELACTQCGKRYHYDVREVHVQLPTGEKEEVGADDFVPFHHGFVIRDDVRCKHCAATNAIELTPASRDCLGAELIRILAHARVGSSAPAWYPMTPSQLSAEKENPPSLRQMERDLLQVAEDHSGKAGAHLGLGKFYEYVKHDGSSRQAYLRALDLDGRCLEAMAGLARMEHAAGRLKEALEWIESCFDQLDSGRFYMVKDRAEFKKATRDARRQYARELGLKPKEAPVAIHYRLESSDHPKNNPCPCGSGKKYKMCCMTRAEQV